MVMVELNQDNWEEEVSRSNVLTLVYFWHQQCPWCRQLTPILERLAEYYLGKNQIRKVKHFRVTVKSRIGNKPWSNGYPYLDFLL
jgi:thioredoxin-like negative regulator of GroEL